MDAAWPPGGHDHDPIRLLMAEHHEIDGCFERYERLREFAATGDDTVEARRHLALQICTMLVVHATIEETLFYPAVRGALDDPFVIDEATVEHAIVKDLIRQIRAARPGLPLYDARVAVLCQMVRHHVCEEENRLFPRVRRARLDLRTLGRRMRDHREALMLEATLPEEGELPA